MKERTRIDELRSMIEAQPRFRPMQSGRATCRCPAHEDRNPSLSFTIGDDGRLLLHCFAGCSIESVLIALGGFVPADLFPPDAYEPLRLNAPQWRVPDCRTRK